MTTRGLRPLGLGPCGILTLDRPEVAHLLAAGDTRWIHRGAYDLMDHQPQATKSSSQMPRARSLYGSLPDQLQQRNSFISRLQDILVVRRRFGLATSTQVDIPAVSEPALLVMVHRLDGGLVQVTALNFSSDPIADRVTSVRLRPGATIRDMLSERKLGVVDDDGSFSSASVPTRVSRCWSPTRPERTCQRPPPPAGSSGPT